jgi:CIC family chloride channel protein
LTGVVQVVERDASSRPSWAVPRLPGGRFARAYAWLRESPPGLMIVAVVVGVCAGLGAILFRYLIVAFTIVFSGSADYSDAGRVAHPWLPWLGVGFVVLAPIVGGLVYGPLVDWFAREARGHGVPEVMLAVAAQGGRIRTRVAVVKAFASAICIGCGGSVGREGPIVQIGSALGSSFGQRLRFPVRRVRLLVACGAAGGISATFNTPIAGVFFALELILRDFETESFGTVVLASIAANVVSRAAFGAQPFLPLPPFQLVSFEEYPLYMGLGLLAAGAGVAFIRVLYGVEDLVDRYWRGPEWLRPAGGGVLLGLLLLALPQMYGVGYPVLQHAIRGDYTVAFLAVLLVGKLLATSLTIAIGGSGGVFAPSLFQGAMLGTGYGVLVQRLLPGATAPPGAYGLVGMGAVFAAAARAPITAVLMIFELTGEYRIILPLMFAIVIATALSRVLTRDTIYTMKLRRRGIDLLRASPRSLMSTVHVREAMQPLPPAIPQSLPLEQAIVRFAGAEVDALPVVDESGRLIGVLSRDLIERSLQDSQLDTTAGEAARRTATVGEHETLEQALAVLVREHSGVPVLSSEGGQAIGWLAHRDVLSAYARRLGTPDDSRE